MRSFLLPLAGAALAAVLGLGALAVLTPAPQPSASAQAAAIAADLRCPDCQGLSVAESQTAAARAIRAEIAELLDAGRTPAEVRQHFVDRYGQWIVLTPSSPVPWLMPAVALVAGGAWLAWWLWRRAPSAIVAGQGDGVETVDAVDLRRVREEVESLDA